MRLRDIAGDRGITKRLRRGIGRVARDIAPYRPTVDVIGGEHAKQHEAPRGRIGKAADGNAPPLPVEIGHGHGHVGRVQHDDDDQEMPPHGLDDTFATVWPQSSRCRRASAVRFAMSGLLFLTAFVAAAISGVAGFGGALLLLPVLTVAVGPGKAVPLLTVAQLIGNALRVVLGRKDIHWRPVVAFLVTALPCTLAGALLFVGLPSREITRSIGAVLLMFAALKWCDILRFPKRPLAVMAGGAVVGLLSGYVGSAGPLAAAVFHAIDLPPLAYVASEACTALSLHALKLVVYQRYLELGTDFCSMAVTLGVAMIAGTWASRMLVERLAVDHFRSLVTILMGVIGLSMLVLGGR